MAIVLEQLIRNLSDSGLLPADEVTSFHEKLASRNQPVDPDAAVPELITAGKLTPYQAECVCRGETGGLVFGDYLVLDKIGQGGMGVVLKAQHRRMDRIVAVKKLTAQALEWKRRSRSAARIGLEVQRSA